MRSAIKKIIRILIGVSIGIVCFVGVTWLLSKAMGYTPPIRCYGQTMEYWSAAASANDVAASNQANAVLNAEIIPMLTSRMLHETNDPPFRVAVVNALNSLLWTRKNNSHIAPDRRISAALSLGEFGPAAKAAVPALVQTMQNDWDAQEAAIVSLGRIHCQPQIVIPLLTKYLDVDGLDDAAAISLGEFGPLAHSAVPQIVPMLSSGDANDQAAAREALTKIDPVAYTNAMNELLKPKNK